MRVPTIHSNGTSRDELLDQQVNAGNGLRAAIAALEDAAPNARDYYFQGADAFTEAQREHAARIERVSAVLAEVTELAEAIAD